MDKSFVWHSTEQSIANQQYSIAGCIEIAWSVFLYWFIWYWLDTHWHLLSSLIAAPLLLLRSPESIKQGVAWFNSSESVAPSSGRGIFSIVMLAVGTLVICWAWASVWLPGYTGFGLFWRAMVIGAAGFGLGLGLGFGAGAGVGAIAVAGAGAVAGAVAVVVAGSVLIPFMVVGFWLVTLLIRLLATLKYLLCGCRSFTRNWHENMFSIDPWQPPTLLPGDQASSAATLLGEFANQDWVGKILNSILLAFIYIPALLYRWSIKSTFWFYWPLLYIRSGQFKAVVDKVTFNDTILEHPVEQLRLIFAVLTLAILAYVFFVPETFIDIHQANPAMFFPYLIAIDLQQMKPWQWLQLATAIITLWVWVIAWYIEIAAKSAAKLGVDYDWAKVTFIHQLTKLRNLTTGCYLLIALVFMVLALGGYQYLSADWGHWFSDFFDTQFELLNSTIHPAVPKLDSAG